MEAIKTKNTVAWYTPTQKLAVIVLVLLGIWMYAPALQLPLSLIDDYTMLRNLDRWKSAIADHGFAYAVQHDVSVEQGIYNIGFWILGALEFTLTNGQPFHWLRLAELSVVCFILFKLICMAGQFRRGAIWAAIGFTATFYAAEVPATADFKALRINWYRHFASDADALVFLSCFCFSILKLAVLRTSADKKWWIEAIWIGLSVIFGCLSFSMKIPVGAVVLGSVTGLGIASFAAGARSLFIRTILMFIFLTGTFIIYYGSLDRLHIDKQGHVYSQNYSFAFEQIWIGLKYYLKAYSDMYGPLFPAVCALIPWALWITWGERTGRHQQTFLCLVFFLTMTGCTFCLYLPWKSILPRYVLMGVFGFNVVAGIIATLVLQSLSEIFRSNKRWLVTLPAGIVAAFLPPVILLILIFILGMAALLHLTRAGVPFLTGTAMVGALYVAAVAPAVRSASNYVYIHREKANWDMTLTLLKYNAMGRSICFAGDARDEHIGSMAGLVARMGVEPRIYSMSDKQHCGPDSLVLIHRWLSPAGSESSIGDRHLVKGLGGIPGKFPVPVSFWEFRKRVFKTPTSESMVNYWQTDYVWRLYDR